MKKDKYKFIDNFGTILSVLGFILLFVGIWSNGWNVLRFIVTAILLIVWGQGLWAKYEKLKGD